VGVSFVCFCSWLFSEYLDLSIVGVLQFAAVFGPPAGASGALERSFADRKANMFDSARLRLRLLLLEEVLLPGLAAQTDDGFKLIVLVTDNLPDDISCQLQTLAGRFPFMEILTARHSSDLRTSCEAIAARWVDAGAGRWATFSVSEESVLSSDYIMRLRAHLEQGENTTAVSFLPGIEMRISQTLGVQAKPEGFPTGADGLALLSHRHDIAAKRAFPTVLQLGPYRQAGQHVPVVEDRSGPAYLRILPGSGQIPPDWSHRPMMQDDLLHGHLDRVFPSVDIGRLTRLAALFPDPG